MKRNTDKTYTATKEVNGVTYRAQFNGVREAVRATNQYSGNELSFDEYLLSNVIVDPPGLQLDDFEDMDEYRQVIRFAASVMTGRFRSDKDDAAAETGSKKKLAGVEAGVQ